MVELTPRDLVLQKGTEVCKTPEEVERFAACQNPEESKSTQHYSEEVKRASSDEDYDSEDDGPQIVSFEMLMAQIVKSTERRVYDLDTKLHQVRKDLKLPQDHVFLKMGAPVTHERKTTIAMAAVESNQPGAKYVIHVQIPFVSNAVSKYATLLTTKQGHDPPLNLYLYSR